MSDTPFRVGQVVNLKSGGPQMTVEEVKGDRIKCTWFDDKHTVQSREFPAGILEDYLESLRG